MDNYSNLVSRILKIETLANAAKEITENESDSACISLNLVTPDWEALLEQHEDFKHCQFRSERKPISTETYYEYEMSKETLFKITLAANCRFIQKNEELQKYPTKQKNEQKNGIIISNSEPLAKIARAMTMDTGSHIPISDNHKFNFRNCNILTCNHCTKSANFFAKKGYTMKKSHQPCIAITKVFDGKNIYNRFYTQLEESFKNENFIGILHLKINVRYMYSDKNNGGQKIYRIGGVITNMLAFDEAKLDLVQAINLGDITTIDESVKETNETIDTNIISESELNEDQLFNIDTEDNVFSEVLDDINGIQSNKRSRDEVVDDILLNRSGIKKPRVIESILSID